MDMYEEKTYNTVDGIRKVICRKLLFVIVLLMINIDLKEVKI
jgi:hypothetical protein